METLSNLYVSTYSQFTDNKLSPISIATNDHEVDQEVIKFFEIFQQIERLIKQLDFVYRTAFASFAARNLDPKARCNEMLVEDFITRLEVCVDPPPTASTLSLATWTLLQSTVAKYNRQISLPKAFGTVQPPFVNASQQVKTPKSLLIRASDGQYFRVNANSISGILKQLSEL